MGVDVCVGVSVEGCGCGCMCCTKITLHHCKLSSYYSRCYDYMYTFEGSYIIMYILIITEPQGIMYRHEGSIAMVI